MTYLNLEQRVRRLRKRIEELEFWVLREREPITGWTLDGHPHRVGDPWRGEAGVFAFVHGPVTIPRHWPHGHTRLRLDLGGEGLLTIRSANGNETKYGLNPYHASFPVPGDRFTMAAECVARLPFGVPARAPRIALSEIAWVEDDLADLVMMLTQVAELAQVLGGHDTDQVPLDSYHPYRPHPDHSRPHEVVQPLLTAAENALGRLHWPSATQEYLGRVQDGAELQGIWQLPGNLNPRPPALDGEAIASVVVAREGLRKDLHGLRERYPQTGGIALSGHAHIDLAWLWPMEETRRKAVRTFHTAISLMDRFPEYRFNQSTAQLYAFLEEDDPALLAAIREKVAAGQWELIGASWVEPDTNMPTGESLARQFLYGTRTFERLFGRGRRTNVHWLPDCFGFSPALPQLMRLAGLDSIFTHKTNWSEKNKLPSDLFWWEGLDGSRVLMHTFDNPAGGYNGRIGPRAAIETWRNFQDKESSRESLLLYGWGDGGGGPTEEMLLRIDQLKNFPALPALRQVNVAEWFSQTTERARDSSEMPIWVGELYLEYHRGTLTTQGRTKYLHRRAERALITAETVGGLAVLRGAAMPPSLEESWHVLLRNQFHDILPGSSIREVYELAEAELASVVAAGEAAQRRHLDTLAATFAAGDAPALLVINPDLSPRPLRIVLSETLDGAQSVEGGSVIATAETIPALSVNVIPIASLTPQSGVAAGPDFLENAFIRVTLSATGALAGVYDKRAGRECLAGPGNRIMAYEDKPRLFDAWDIEENYAAGGEEIIASEPPVVFERGPHRAAIHVVRRYRNSTIRQTVRLWSNSARIEFKTDIDWHDRRVLVKALFPLAIRADHALFECAFGVIARPTHRNTPWDQAKFEVAAHRFVDLAEHGYGVALLNDGKYGHHALGNELGISLLRSPVYPDPLADEGAQSFTYAMLPHRGDWLSGGVVAEAEDLNQPLLHRPINAEAASSTPLRVNGMTLGLGSLKPAEDGTGLILRAYEPAGARGAATVTLPRHWKLAGEVNLLEEPMGSPSLSFTPFQVRSWLLARG